MSSAAGSSRSRRAPNTAANTASKALTCDGSDTNTALAVQYSRLREIGLTSPSACAKWVARCTVTGTPASCSRRPNAAASSARSSSIVCTSKPASAITASRRTGDQLAEPRSADQLLVLGVLEHRAERPLHRRLVKLFDAEHGERRNPVDRLGNPWWLLHVGVAHPGHRTDYLHGQRLRRPLDPPADDVDLALRRGVVDPVIQAAPLD